MFLLEQTISLCHSKISSSCFLSQAFLGTASIRALRPSNLMALKRSHFGVSRFRSGGVEYVMRYTMIYASFKDTEFDKMKLVNQPGVVTILPGQGLLHCSMKSLAKEWISTPSFCGKTRGVWRSLEDLCAASLDVLPFPPAFLLVET